jgi:hypothetical protein
MWRVVLSISAVVCNVLVLLVVALAALGFAIIFMRNSQIGAPPSAAQFAGMIFITVSGLASALSIAAIALRAHWRRRPETSASQIANEFS